MENKTLEKTLDTLGNMTKLAANLSDVKPRPVVQKTVPDDNSNNASTGNQSVNVVLDTGKKKDPKPIEKHVHTYPENRPLTSEECQLDLQKAQMDYELQKSQMIFQQKAADREWQHKMELEKKAEKKGKIRNIIIGCFAVLGIGGLGYSMWYDYKHGNNQQAPKALPETFTVKTEGEVK